MATFEHFIYGIVPKKGYSIRAKSANVFPEEYEQTVGYFVPINPDMVQQDSSLAGEARAIVSVTTRDCVYYSRFFKRTGLDDYGRAGILSHTVLIPRSIFNTGIAFNDLERALLEFEGRYEQIPIGEVPPIEILAHDQDKDADLEDFKSLISKETVLAIRDSFVKDPKTKFAIVCNGSTNEKRMKLCRALSKFFDIKSQAVRLSVISETPIFVANSMFNMVLTRAAPNVPTNGSWKVINWGIQAASGGTGDKIDDSQIDKLFG